MSESILNPWAVDCIDKFLYFFCPEPECENKCQTKQDFVDHAFCKHPEGAQALLALKDDITDINLPDNIDVKPDILLPKSEANSDSELLFEDTGFEIENDDIKGDFKCFVCEKLFETANQLSSHGCANKSQKENSQSQQISSDPEEKCLKTYTNQNGRNNKKRKVKIVKTKSETDPIIQSCPECGVKFRTNHKLRMHMLKEHKMANFNSERCLCSLCGKTLVGRSNFKKHEREKHGIDNIHRKRIIKELKLECPKCLEGFEDTMELNSHAVECEGMSKDFSCPSCDLLWATGSVLNAHLKKDHRVGEMYTCDICGKCFKRKISVDSHIKVEHEGIKDHVCHLCGTGFARAQGLKFHIQRVHEHSGRYACEYCDFKTVAQMKLDIHVNEVHTKSIKYPCRDCNFFCYRKGGLLAHVKTVHLKLKPHECPTCPEAYVRRKELEKHRSIAGH